MAKTKKTYWNHWNSRCLTTKWRNSKKEKRRPKEKGYRTIWIISEKVL